MFIPVPDAGGNQLNFFKSYHRPNPVLVSGVREHHKGEKTYKFTTREFLTNLRSRLNE